MRLQSPTWKMPRIDEKRRGIRLNSRAPVTIEWQDSAGKVLQAEAFTRIVGPYGCMIVLPVELLVTQAVRVVNKATGASNEGVVVWKGSERGDGWELGIELTNPPMDFWGLDL